MNIKRSWRNLFQKEKKRGAKVSNVVTVVIPFYNPGRYFDTAIKSVFEQVYEDWKLLLVDDGSTEAYEEGIQKYLADPRVELLKLDNNVGQSKALNKALEKVTSSYIIR